MKFKVENRNSIDDITLSFECKNNSEFLHIVEREREREREPLLIDSFGLNIIYNVNFESPC